MIVVAPRSCLPAVLREHAPSRAIALRSPDADPYGFELPKHAVLDLAFNDIAEDREGLVSPAAKHVAAMLAFARAWDRQAPLLVHCYAGISRSTAAALIVAAALMPERDEAELGQTLRRLAPEATPNPYVVRLADGMLGREGRLTDAVERIGRGAEAFEGTPFVLPLQSIADGGTDFNVRVASATG